MSDPNRRGGWVAIAASGLLVVLAGCRGGPGPQDHFYRIEATSPTAIEHPPPLDGALEVEPLAGEAVLTALPLLYRASSSSALIERYGYHLWTDPPALMLQHAIGSWIEASGLARQVVYPEQRVRPTYVLRGRIERLEHHRGERAVLLALQLDLAGDAGATPILSGRYSERIQAEDASVRAAVEAYSLGLDLILEQFRADLEETSREPAGNR